MLPVTLAAIGGVASVLGKLPVALQHLAYRLAGNGAVSDDVTAQPHPMQWLSMVLRR